MRSVDFDNRTIPFTQYMMPNGEPKAVETSDPLYTDDDLKRAQQFIEAGYSFHIEMLRNGIISLTLGDGDGDYVHLLCKNNSEVPETVCALIRTYDLRGLNAVREAVNGEGEEDDE